MARGLKFRIKKVERLHYVVKTKALISCAVTAQLICAFVFAYAKSCFSHEAAHFIEKSVWQLSLIWATSWGNLPFAYPKTKAQISCVVTVKLIGAFVLATKIVQSVFLLNPKFQASNHLLCVCVGPGRKPQRQIFHDTAYTFCLALLLTNRHHIAICVPQYWSHSHNMALFRRLPRFSVYIIWVVCVNQVICVLKLTSQNNVIY